MSKRTVSGKTLTLLFIGMLTLAFDIQPVKSGGTICIRADGSVEPNTAPIFSADNITYTFADNINDSIVAEKSNIIIDGAGYTIEGTGAWNSKGISLSSIFNVTVKNTNIKNFYYGIRLHSSSNNSISGNNIANNLNGIDLDSSSNNSISGNNIANNWAGIWLDSSSNNSISGNNVTANNGDGIWLHSSSNNLIYHNNFMYNTQQVHFYESGYTNSWDNGYPYGGNYWSDYTGVDYLSGPYQNETGSDGIGDHPYIIDENNLDNYPIKKMLFLYELMEKYSNLLADFDSLNSTYNNLLSEFNTLNSSHNELKGQYSSLNSSYTALQDSSYRLQSDQESIINELSNVKNLLYVFIATTMTFMATTVYLARRSKVKLEAR